MPIWPRLTCSRNLEYKSAARSVPRHGLLHSFGGASGRFSQSPGCALLQQFRSRVDTLGRAVWKQGRKMAKLLHFQDTVAENLAPRPVAADSIELRPWEHPFLTADKIRRFREYSLAVRDLALRRWRAVPRKLDIGFCINIAQNSYKWARMVQRAGRMPHFICTAGTKGRSLIPNGKNSTANGPM